MRNITRFGVFIPTGYAQWGEGTDPRRLIDFAARAERLGFDSLWVNDSLLSPRIESLTMLAAVAPATERVTLGTATLLPVLRRPLQAAQAIASVDLLAGGRLVLAVGAGFPGRFGQPLHTLSEVPWAGRFKRLDETVELWRQLWSSQETQSFHGEVLSFDEIPPSTAPFQPGGPPIWLGGATPSALARTGRAYDGWLPYPPDPADYARGLTGVREAASAAGREPDTLTPALMVTLALTDDAAAGRAILEQYSLANYGVPLEVLQTIQAVTAGPPDEVAAWLRRYLEAGARHVVCRIAALTLDDHLMQLERIAALADTLP
jgi:alkanesulfonate monooxygenase SsuD/methylene tetrahydromethanopterin reductase-like flavin-dependent oxidoreductase (luciferase family)